MKFLTGTIFKITVLIAVVFMILFFSGCRQEPAEKVKYYEYELKQMREQKLRAMKQKQENTYVKDGYPWQRKPDKLNTVPCSIKTEETSIDKELNYLGEFIHGKKKTCEKLRY